MLQTKQKILKIYQQALIEISGEICVLKKLQIAPDYICPHIIAIGKAAESMLEGAIKASNGQFSSAFIISKINHISDSLKAHPKITCIETAHPIPDKTSLEAGKLLIKYLNHVVKNEPVLFLISGGTSSLVELLKPDETLQSLQTKTEQMLVNGYDIFAINKMRQSASQIKAGRLWQYIKSLKVRCLLISDVANNDPCVIGSGLLFDPNKKRQINHFKWQIIASNTLFLNKVSAIAKKEGFKPIVEKDFLGMDVHQAVKICLQTVYKNPNKLLIWGAETTVKLPLNYGKGGRNQHFGLAFALAIKENKNIICLAGATDGSDGLTDNAGALIDATLFNNKNDYQKAFKALAEANSNSILLTKKALITTGVTGTNVMDIVIAQYTNSSDSFLKIDFIK